MKTLTKEAVMKQLKEVKDPEIGINLVDLGLIYGVRIGKGMVVVDMTFTSPACPVGPLIIDAVEQEIKKLNGVTGATINIVWDPAWNSGRLSEEARAELG